MNVPIKPDELLTQGTCAILINDKVCGTGFLISDEGYVLTAGHLLNTEKSIKIAVHFQNELKRSAEIIHRIYYKPAGIDFGILRFDVPPNFGRKALPMYLTKSVSEGSSFRLRGYGLSLKDQSPGIGKFLPSFYAENVKDNLIFLLECKESGEEGYSGAPIYSDQLNRVVAIQTETLSNKAGAGRDTVLAMPLYRIAKLWDQLNKFAEQDILLVPHYSPIFNRMEDEDWASLIRYIKLKQWTPIVGPEIYEGILPLPSSNATNWADKYSYPLPDKDNLSRVAEFLAVYEDPIRPKLMLHKQIEDVSEADLSTSAYASYHILAKLNSPLYITTNYDNLLFKILKRKPGCEPQCESFPWQAKSGKPREFMCTPEKPLVYHLYGYYEQPDSMVLIEVEHLEFLINFARGYDKLPASVAEALSSNSLMFIGYNLSDWSFRLLFNGLLSSIKRSNNSGINIAIQQPFPYGHLSQQGMEDYLYHYFKEVPRLKKSDTINIRFYWGTVHDFLKDLYDRYVRHA